MTSRLYIIAGNLGEYNDYKRHYFKDRDCVYVSEVYKLLGARDFEYFYCGTYFKRKDLPEIQKHLMQAVCFGDAKELRLL